MKKWLMSLSKAKRYFVVLLPLIISGILIIAYAAVKNIFLLILFIISAITFGVFLYYNGQVEMQLKKDKETTTSEQQGKVLTGNIIESKHQSNEDKKTIIQKPFESTSYSLIDTNYNLSRAIYWKDGSYSFFHPKIVTLSDQNDHFDVFVNENKIGTIDGSYSKIKNNLNKIYNIEIGVYHDREQRGNDYEPWITINYCSEYHLQKFPNYRYMPRGQRISNFLKPTFLEEYIVLDTETTGIDVTKDDIIEVSALHILNGNIVGQFSELIYSDKITAESSNKNHIFYEDVKNARDVYSVINDFANFLGDVPIIGHNLDFDLKFICAIHPVSNKFDDTCILADEFLKPARGKFKINNCKLETVCAVLGVHQESAHRALSDCFSTYQCYEKFKKLFPEILKDNEVEIKNPVVKRNIAAKELEKTDIEQAIKFYEENINDDFDGSFPYDRLIIIYKKQKRIDDAIRVANKAIYVFENVVSKDRADRKDKLEKYKLTLSKLQTLNN